MWSDWFSFVGLHTIHRIWPTIDANWPERREKNQLKIHSNHVSLWNISSQHIPVEWFSFWIRQIQWFVISLSSWYFSVASNSDIWVFSKSVDGIMRVWYKFAFLFIVNPCTKFTSNTFCAQLRFVDTLFNFFLLMQIQITNHLEMCRVFVRLWLCFEWQFGASTKIYCSHTIINKLFVFRFFQRSINEIKFLQVILLLYIACNHRYCVFLK